jgi:hypothetical protein
MAPKTAREEVEQMVKNGSYLTRDQLATYCNARSVKTIYNWIQKDIEKLLPLGYEEGRLLNPRVVKFYTDRWADLSI